MTSARYLSVSSVAMAGVLNALSKTEDIRTGLEYLETFTSVVNTVFHKLWMYYVPLLPTETLDSVCQEKESNKKNGQDPFLLNY